MNSSLTQSKQGEYTNSTAHCSLENPEKPNFDDRCKTEEAHVQVSIYTWE